MRREDSLQKTPTLGRREGKRRRGGRQRRRWLDVAIDAMNVTLGKLRETVADKGAGGLACCGP